MRTIKLRPTLLPLLLLLLLGTGFSGVAGCKSKKAPAPAPAPIPPPPAPPGSVLFIQRGHLARLDLETSKITPLTSGISAEWFPAASPKGDQVAYWSNAGGGVYNLWKVNLDGTQRVQLTFDETNSLPSSAQNLLINNSPCWSSDGAKILYTTLDGSIWTMDADGYNNETLLLGHSALCPAYSPMDGKTGPKTVVFISNFEDTVYNLWQLTLSDRSLKKLTSYTDWNVGSPSFSPDGSRVLISLYRANVSQIYSLKADGSDPVQITTAGTGNLCPRYAQGGKKIVYCALEDSGNVGLNVLQMNADGKDSKALTHEGGSSPSWSPGQVQPLAPVPLKTK